MSGVIILGYLGWLDTDFIYINPTYLEGAILGGVIMGFGFIIGGYCPGTSVCGAAIGKIDAMFFVGGGLLGVFAFAEGYPMFEEIYHASFLGNLRIFNSLGMSQGVFALVMIVVAVGAFMATTKIERKVDAEGPAKSFNGMTHRIAGGGIIALGIVLVFLPDYKQWMLAEVSSKEYLATHPVKEMSSDELAFRILDNDRNLQIIDVREGTEFAKMRLPGSFNIQTGQLFQKEFSGMLGLRHKKKVFVADNETEAREAALLAERIGYSNVSILCGGFPEFITTIIKEQPAEQTRTCSFNMMYASNKQQQPPARARYDARYIKDTDRFRAKAGVEVAAMIKEAQNKPVKAPKLVKKVAGGC
jgi:rhodanese-related sulfurtransferase